MKKLILIIICLVTITFLGGCTKEEPKELADNERFKEEYESLNGQKYNNQTIRKITIAQDNPFIYKTASDIVDMMDQKKSFVVYFGFAKCPWCRSMIEELITVAKENNIGIIYYVDISEIRDTKEYDETGTIITTKEGTSAYKELLDKFASVLEDYTIKDSSGTETSTGEKRIYAPNVIAVINGQATQLETGNSDLQTNPYQELTPAIKKDMHEKLSCLAKCLNDAKTTCDTRC